MQSKFNYRHYLAFAFTVILTSSVMAQNDSLAFGDKEGIDKGFVGKLYAVPLNSSSIPRFDTMQQIGTVYTQKFDISPRDWSTGFPGIPDRKEWFGIVYTGKFEVTKKGKHIFRLLSDDGSRLYIDNKLVIDNDGLHFPESRLGDIELSKGKHSLKLEYFQGPPQHIALQLFVTYEKEPEQVFPGNNIQLTSIPKKIRWKTYLVYAGIGLVLLLILLVWARRKRKIPVD